MNKNCQSCGMTKKRMIRVAEPTRMEVKAILTVPAVMLTGNFKTPK